jgi:putative addiction module component (TIGR02574 family)
MLPAEKIFEAAMELEPAERSRLVAELSATLQGLELGDEWEDEIAKRVEDLGAGRVIAIPGDQVFGPLEQRFRGK